MLKHLQSFNPKTEIISGQLVVHFIRVPPKAQLSIAEIIKHQEGVLLTEWLAPVMKDNQDAGNAQSQPIMAWTVLYLQPKQGLFCITSLFSGQQISLVDLSKVFPVANRLQRALYELTRVPVRGMTDKRNWLNHGYWPKGILNKESKTKNFFSPAAYVFHKVTGDDVHEIPVGPVHAGIIEPGHFRFSVVGERILKLEERLGYTHKGIHSLLRNRTLTEAGKIIGRVSGDSTVAYAWAFAMACEQAYHQAVSQEVLLFRAILLERERILNHIGDIGAIVNDAALPSLQSQFTLLKEQGLRHNQEYVNHRYMMDCIVPFQTNQPLSTNHLLTMEQELTLINARLIELENICNQHAGLQDRLVAAGILSTSVARDLGVVGLVAKASGIDLDIRRIAAYAPYHLKMIDQFKTTLGDVADRVVVRFKECFESIKLIKTFIKDLNYKQEHQQSSIATHSGSHTGLGCVEGWRGPIIVNVIINDEKIQFCHFHDPSWQNWPALEQAVLDNIVADFPLINKSFNLSYSGQDS
ncbi:MAG: hypothetical protein A3E87_02990 [Gammaproteobacteria bacterium RIFCSPHIGHO2_12_FULL_35_23]|nr:MAG: hypothetical protein A3E87_02990 [Gammaproteobacteria bacterium RIFCSPHIGHO2_12_FULL_35_23]